MVSNEMRMGEGTLAQAARLVSGARQDFTRMSGELEGQIAGLRGGWAGAGGQAFFVLHQAWTERQRVVVDALDAFEASLLVTGRDLAATDDTQATYFTRFHSRLG